MQHDPCCFVAELRHFLQYVFINWRCDFSPCGFSQLPVRTVEGSLQRPSPNPRSLLASYLVRTLFPHFHASEHTSRESSLMSVLLHLSPGPFSPSHCLTLSLPAGVTAHFIRSLFVGLKTFKQVCCNCKWGPHRCICLI